MKQGPPTIHQLARDMWLAEISFAYACRLLNIISAKQCGAVLVIYTALDHQERSINYGKVS